MVTCRACCRNFALWLFNPEEKTILNRGCKNWFQIFAYYAIFYSILAAFGWFLLLIFLYPIFSRHPPTLTGMHSLLKLNPGLSTVPPADFNNPVMRVTTFNSKYKQNYLNYLKNYFANYTMTSSNCDFETGQRLSGTIQDSCRFPLSLLGPCASPTTYLADYENACYYLKLNKIYGYLPDIKGNKITVKCKTKQSRDSEYLGQPVYYPSVQSGNETLGYFSSVAFPYILQPNYQVPLLAVTFPNVKRNTVITVSCGATNLANAQELRFEISVDTQGKTPG